MRLSRVFVSSAVVLGVCGGAVAGPVTVNVTGTSSTTFGGITSGDAFSASLTYETSTLPFLIQGNGSFFETATLHDWTVGGFSYTSATGEQLVSFNVGGVGAGQDAYAPLFTTLSGASQDTLPPLILNMDFRGPTGILSGHTALPSATQMGQFTEFDASMRFGIFGNSEQVFFDISSVEIIDNPVIPLPTGAAMAMVGMGVIGVRRRRN